MSTNDWRSRLIWAAVFGGLATLYACLIFGLGWWLL
jgi:hypothetical protein